MKIARFHTCRKRLSPQNSSRDSLKFIAITIGIIASLGFSTSCSKPSHGNENESIVAENKSPFVGRARHNEDISIYVDFALPSSEHRFFVYDNRNDSVIAKSKCAHGCGNGSTVTKPVFSNTPGSNCSSLGEYRLRAVGQMNGINLPCIRIDGLSSTNSNAASRGIVIHEGPILADDITLGVPIPVSQYISQGCFTISSSTFHLLTDLMKQKKSIYLYAYRDR